MTMKKTMSWLVMLAAVLVAALVTAAEASVAPGAMEAKASAAAPWPLWDGKESVADYAKRAGIKDVETTLDLGGGVAVKLTLIPAGKYIRGLREEESETIEGVRVLVREADKGWTPGEGPQSEVTLTKPFYMGVYEVTQEQYEQIMGNNPSEFKGKNLPVEHVRNEPWEFCEKLSAKTGQKVSLPTEAQWEFAYRAGTKTRFYWGDDSAEMYKYANYADKSVTLAGIEWMANYGLGLDKDHNDGFDKTAPVGSFKPNNFGLYDMQGNAAEWCSDWHTGSYFGAPTVDPAGPAYYFPPSGGFRVTKRSGFLAGLDSCGWYHIGGAHAAAHITSYGFRVAVALKSTGAPAQEAKAKNPPKAAPAVPVPATAGPADPKVRVPAGCRAAPGTQAEPYTKSGWAQAIVHEATGMEMVYVPAGSFIRGFNLREPTKEEQDTVTYLTMQIGGQLSGPHRVTLTKGFYMGKTEVTQAQWEKLLGKNPAHFKNAGPEAPVEMVTWNDCQEFCQKAGGGLRLPSEAEWEYACRAGTTGLYAGDPEALGWYFSNSDGTTHPVGTKTPNAWGLYDMHGNVWEWCQDWFDNYEGSNDKTDPMGPAKESNYLLDRVIRGGGWGDYGSHCISAIRCGFVTYKNPKHFAVGCRFVITAAGVP